MHSIKHTRSHAHAHERQILAPRKAGPRKVGTLAPKKSSKGVAKQTAAEKPEKMTATRLNKAQKQKVADMRAVTGCT